MKFLKFLLISLFVLVSDFNAQGQEAAESVTEINEVAVPDSADNSLEENFTGSKNGIDLNAENGSKVIIDMAAQAYREQDYKRSIELYEEAVEEGIAQDMVSSQIYYNLGNAYFRDNQIGRAILNYERALQLDPGDGDIRHNLRFANNRTVDRITPAGSFFLSNWFKALRDIFSSNVWATIAIVLFILFITSAAVYLFVRILWARKTAFYAGIVFFLFMIIANIFSFSQKSERIRSEYAIVMVGAAGVNASPDVNSNELFELHEGTKVKVRSIDGNWYEIEIINGSVGWTQKENIVII